MCNIFDDRPREECGVFGIYGFPQASFVVALGLHALQHRGQEAAGIVSSDEEGFYLERHLGLVNEVFSSQKTLEELKGANAIGHVRYSTCGGTLIRNIQPLFAELETGGLALAHNGNITNAQFLRRKLVSEGSITQSSSDSEVVLHLAARSTKPKLTDKLIDALLQIEGGFAFVMMTGSTLIGARDRLGIRPLVLGRLEQSYVLASETCALDAVGARFVRDIENGEMVVIDQSGLTSIQFTEKVQARPCIFEYVYFSRPDSFLNGKSIYQIRKNLGKELAKETQIKNGIVVPVPDSGVPAALGFAEQSQLPFEMGIIRNHYVGRTFIQPTQSTREISVKKKHSANREVIQGKDIILVDDSIVRGTTAKKIVRMLREGGAREVHLVVSAPPIKYSDYYGIDTPDPSKLIAATYSIDKIRDHLGLDSLHFLSIEGLYRALGEDRRNAECPQYSDHCFTGDYPTPLHDLNDKDREFKASLLKE